MELTVRQIAEAAGGRLLCGDAAARVTSVCLDSRQLKPGCLFVPVVGERVDAHRFLGQAEEAGAAAAFTQEHDSASGRMAWIRVPDTRRALQDLAAWHRSRFSIPVVGVTGSVGKTTTKEMVALALSASFSVLKTEGNRNSQLGLPLTLLGLSPADGAAVIEMGMSEFGEMARLAAVARPDYAVVTNIGVSHLENLKTQENIRSEKLHITDAFHEGSVLFLNGDDPLLAALRGKTACRTVFYGTQPWCGVRAEALQTSKDGSRFTAEVCGRRWPVEIPAPGRHNVLNALAALAVAFELCGGDCSGAVRALAQYRPPAMRQQIHTVGGVTVIDDSYNASPDSMRSSLDVLASLRGSGRCIAVLADMLELGDYSAQAHEQVGAYAAQAGADLLAAVGAAAEGYCRGAAGKSGLQARHFLQKADATAFLQREIQPGDVVLVKGSRGMKMEEIVHALLEDALQKD